MNLTLLITVLTIVPFAFAKKIDLDNFFANNTAYNYLEKVGRRLAEKIRTAEPKNFEYFIAEGTTSDLGLHPYQVGLLFTFSMGESVCGGSLINSKRVLTAAHCWFDGKNQATDIVAVLGSIYLFSGGTRIKTHQIVMHSGWTPSLVRNDIAVIYLPSAVSFSSTIGPIALPSSSQLNEDFVSNTAVASGFGYITPDHIFTNDTSLYHVQMKVINNTVCLLSFPIVQPSNICATTADGGGPRRGDSGGPLVTGDGDDGLVLIGVTSFGCGFGCEDHVPSVFARVTSYMNFINSNL